MSDKPARLDDLFDAEMSGKSEALINLDRAAIIGVSALALMAAVVISLVFLSL